MKQFKIRCSAIADIMGGSIGLTDKQEQELIAWEKRHYSVTEKPLTPIMLDKMNDLIDKRDNPDLTAGMKAYCKKWLKEQVYGRRKELDNKYVQKGNACEDKAIDLVSAVNLTSYSKNEEYRENEYMTGTCDIDAPDCIRDTKCSWDVDTFPAFDDSPDSRYIYQVQGYMELWNKPYAFVDYVLVNAPFELLKREAKSIEWKKNIDFEDAFFIACDQLTYDEEHLQADKRKEPVLTLEQRVKSFRIDRRSSIIREVERRVLMCREYIEKLEAGEK